MCVCVYTRGFPGGSAVKNLLSVQERKVHSLGQEDPLEKEIQPTPAFLPGKSHGQRSFACYRPCGCKELDTTQKLNNNIYIYHICFIHSSVKFFHY